MPSSWRTRSADTLTRRGAVPSATWRATLRHTDPISRSSERTPASRVYSVMIVRSAASEKAIRERVSPLRSIWRGTR